MITYANVGVGWLSGGLQRILGETFSTKNYAGFVQAIDVGKIILWSYGAAAALLGIGVVAFLGPTLVPLGAAIVAGIFLLASYEASIERLALIAAARLAAVNLLQFVQVVVYAISAVTCAARRRGIARRLCMPARLGPGRANSSTIVLAGHASDRKTLGQQPASACWRG